MAQSTPQGGKGNARVGKAQESPTRILSHLEGYQRYGRVRNAAQPNKTEKTRKENVRKPEPKTATSIGKNVANFVSGELTNNALYATVFKTRPMGNTVKGAKRRPRRKTKRGKTVSKGAKRRPNRGNLDASIKNRAKNWDKKRGRQNATLEIKISPVTSENDRLKTSFPGNCKNNALYATTESTPSQEIPARVRNAARALVPRY